MIVKIEGRDRYKRNSKTPNPIVNDTNVLERSTHTHSNDNDFSKSLFLNTCTMCPVSSSEIHVIQYDWKDLL
jgi:hypothetical protein